MGVRLPDDVRVLAARLLAHFGSTGEARLEPGAWVLGEWTLTPVLAPAPPAARA